MTDLAVAESNDDGESGIILLQGDGTGTFNPIGVLPLGAALTLSSIVAGPFFGPGPLGLAVTGVDENSVTFVKMEDGGGMQIVSGPDLGPGGVPIALAVGNFDGSGRADLVVGRQGPDNLSVELNQGDGTFLNPDQVGLDSRNTPVVGDLTGDGVADVTIVDGAGNILFRQGIAGQPGQFAPPITINPAAPARDIARVVTARGILLAAVDSSDDFLTMYQDEGGNFVVVGKLPTGIDPAQVVAANLDGGADGDDLIVRNAGDGTLTLYRPDGQGWFLSPITLTVGKGVAGISVADLNGDGLQDILLPNQASGTVEVLWNEPGEGFSTPTIYRAGTGLLAANGNGLTSMDGTVGVVALPLSSNGIPDLVTVNTGSETLGVLSGLGNDQFANPTSLPMSGQALAAQNIEIDGNPGLAVLGPDGVTIWRDLNGVLTAATEPIPAGTDPTGLTVADVNGDGVPDLVVGNAAGDVLVLIGGKDGTFQAPVSTDQGVALASLPAGSNGPATLIEANQATDQVVYGASPSASTLLADQSSGLIAPTALVTADLGGNGLPDLIFANGGGDNVLVYPGLPGGGFGPGLNDGQGYFTGTNPVAITVADVNGDGRPDLIVANEGSNDVTILLNEPTASGFTFVSGPRLKVGVGPVSVAYGDVSGDGTPALVVSDSVSQNVLVLPSLGDGYFNDVDPIILPVNGTPGPVFVGPYGIGDGPDIVTLNPGTDHLTVFSNVASDSFATQTLSTGGLDPVAALAVNGSNGFDDLVVANQGDGTVSLLEGSSQGLVLATSAVTPGVPNPSALALSSLSGDTVNVDAAGAGTDALALLTFVLTGTTAPTPSAASLVLTPPAAPSLTLLPLAANPATPGASLATMLAQPESNANEANTAEVSEVMATMTAAVSINQAPVSSASAAFEFGHDDEAMLDVSSDVEPFMPPISPKAASESYSAALLGVDDAFARFRERVRAETLFPPSGAGTQNTAPRDTRPLKDSRHAPPVEILAPAAAVDEAIDSLIAEREPILEVGVGFSLRGWAVLAGLGLLQGPPALRNLIHAPRAASCKGCDPFGKRSAATCQKKTPRKF